MLDKQIMYEANKLRIRALYDKAIAKYLAVWESGKIIAH